MRKFLALLVVVLLVSSTGIALARMTNGAPALNKATLAPIGGGLDNDALVRVQNGAKVVSDTISFGYYELRSGTPYAVLNGTWTFDHGAALPLEGWTSIDETENPAVYGRQMNATKWAGEGTAPVAWPAMTGNGMYLCGATQAQADTLSWINGRGYGPSWDQLLVGPPLVYDGSGDVVLSVKYFCESEAGYDFLKIWVSYQVVGSEPDSTLINAPGFDLANGGGVDPATGVITPRTFQYTITPSDLGNAGAARPFHICFEFTSDGGVSDSDGPLNAWYGAFGLDDISLTDNLGGGNVAYGFENESLQGWTPGKKAGIGAFMGLGVKTAYPMTDPCACSLVGNVLEGHAGDQISGYSHVYGQEEAFISPIVDRLGDMGAGYTAYNRVFAEWDEYADMPQANGVFLRPGWKYYPYSSIQLPDLVSWSPRVGQATWYYRGDVPACNSWNSIGTDWGLPSVAEKVKFVYEINYNCDSFGITNCTYVSNYSPIIDNIRVRNVGYAAAPVALFDPGTRYQDGFGMYNTIGVLSTTDPGNADVTYNVRMGQDTQPTRLGDSLMVKGPMPSTTQDRWEAMLWFRLKRVGPAQTTAPGFSAWATRAVLGGKPSPFYPAPPVNPCPPVALPSFTWGYMDTVEIGVNPSLPQRDKYCSRYRENDASYLAPEMGPANEILPDGIFVPGTKVEYFVSTNYAPLGGPKGFMLAYPDTLGGVYQEFEILPSFRNDGPCGIGGTDKFPCVLYVDTNSGSQFYIENALDVVLNGNNPPLAVIPDPTRWDRYDYNDASSNWNGPMYRMIGGAGGATIPQLLGYKLIMVSLGDAATGAMEPRDWQGIAQWLGAYACDGNSWLQGFILNGTSAAEVVKNGDPTLLSYLGATLTCPSYNTLGCKSGETDNDQNNCVRIADLNWTPGVPTDVFGNWCPPGAPSQGFDVLNATSAGVGNKQFEKIGSAYKTSYSQITNDQSAGVLKYRSVLDAFGYARLTQRDPSNLGLGECAYTSKVFSADSAARVTAVYAELRNAIKWTLNIADPATQVGLCIDPCGPNPIDVPDETGAGALVTRLYQNHPNPFNPRTAIKFSLAADGPAKLIIYDVNGRRIRTLVDSGLKAGTHDVVWDGTDDAGHTVTSGVYWSQLQAGTYSSNKKMVVLK